MMLIFKRFLAVFFIYLVSVSSYSQVTVTGKVVDAIYEKPTEGVTVDLVKMPDSIKIESTLTLVDGSFLLKKADTLALYKLRLKHMSYKQKFITVKKTKDKTVDMGVITFEPNMMTIKEVTIAGGSKIRSTELLDRTIYEIPSDIKNTSTNALDILRKTPSVYVDFLNEDIRVEGYTNIKLEVDGKERDKGYLKRLHPTQVDKIEVITTPSGKYDASIEAVVNIITKKEYRYGLKGNLMADLPNPEFIISRYVFGLDYGMKKVSFYVSGNMSFFKYESFNNFQRISGSNELNRDGSTNRNGKNIGFTTGLEYTINEKNTLDYNINITPTYLDHDGTTSNYVIQNGITNKIYKTGVITDNNSYGINNSLYFKHKFNKETEHNFTAEISYYTSSSKNLTKNQNSYFLPSDINILLYANPQETEKTTLDRNSLNTQVNYFLPFNNTFSFETGGSMYYQFFNSKSEFSYKESDNLKKYEDLRSSFYAGASKQFEKLGFKGGVRIENSDIKINNTDESSNLSWLPYFNAQYKISKIQNLRFAYLRKVTRPSSDQLNPTVSIIDSFNIRRGNINLSPSYRSRFQLNYSLKLSKVSISPTLYYEGQTGIIQQISTINQATNVTETYPENVSDGYETGITLSASSQFSIFKANTYLAYYVSHIDQYNDQIIAKNVNTLQCNTSIMGQLPKNYFFYVGFEYYGPRLSGQQKVYRSAEYYIAPGKRFKNNSQLMLIVVCPLMKEFTNSKSVIESYQFYQNDRRYTNMNAFIFLRYIYNFRIGKSYNKEHRDVQIDNEGKKLEAY